MTVMKCPKCGQVIEGEVTHCPKCQTPLQTYQKQSIPNWVWFVGFFAVVFLLTFWLGIGRDTESSRNRYSDEYNSNSSYRQNVGEIADAFGESEEHVDEVLDRMNEILREGR